MASYRLVELVLSAVLVVSAIYEAYALITGKPTISRYVWVLQRSQFGPFVPFLAGLLCGHLFWSGK